ncbi:Phox homologous domain [Phytophthora cinnamomi]|uniref:Phox homologous domain n=1 Tax=Phytophthora cinnamomi TaxID=4785 RepID=UPI0035597B6A|nr:Phox homologous domain [Phytophthora cinnamomi]
MAIALNSIHQVRMSKTYDREEHVTVYAVDVFVQSTPTGITKGQQNIKDEMDNGCSAYQVAHRYSSFRMLRQRIGDVVKVSKDKSHSRWCPYCSRVRDIAKSSVFPSRFPTVGIASGLREYVVQSRKALGDVRKSLAARCQGHIVPLRMQSVWTIRSRVKVAERLFWAALRPAHYWYPS